MAKFKTKTSSEAIKEKSTARRAVKAFYSELERPFARACSGPHKPLERVMYELSKSIEHAKLRGIPAV